MTHSVTTSRFKYKESIVFIANLLPHYRIALYNHMAEKYKVTILHSGSSARSEKDKFDEIILPMKKIGPFFFQRRLINIIKKINPDSIIIMFDLRWVMSVALLLLVPTNSRPILWGLDKGKSKLALMLKLFIARRGYHIVFYEKTIMTDFFQLGIKRSKSHVAHNTFHVPHRIQSYGFLKKHVLFVGSLDKRKQLDICIKAFKKVLSEIAQEYKFILIGDGIERESLQQLISTEGLEDMVILHGRENDPVKLGTYYKEAVASLSFGQAGLSVLQSFAFGVPFITKENAISGGEKNNIIHGYNGLLCEDNFNSLCETISTILNDIPLAQNLGKQAFDFYSEQCTIDKMALGLEQAMNKNRTDFGS